MNSASALALPWTTYLWVFGMSVLGGSVGYLNKQAVFKAREYVTICLTSCFNGFMVMCVCMSADLSFEFLLFACGMVGLMGRRAWLDFESIFRGGFIMLRQQQGQDYQQYPQDPAGFPDETVEKGNWGAGDDLPRAPPYDDRRDY